MQLEQHIPVRADVVQDMMVVVGRRDSFGRAQLDEIGRFRHQIFVRDLGWELSCARPEVEEDEFDTNEAIYVRVAGAEREIRGFARLLPTERPYLLQKIFPELFGNSAAPSSPWIWELSRFAIARWSDRNMGELVFRAALAAARERGALQVVGVLSCALERVCRGYGFSLHRLGHPRVLGGMRLVACAVDVPSEPEMSLHRSTAPRPRAAEPQEQGAPMA